MAWIPQIGDEVSIREADGEASMAGRVVEDFGDFPARAVEVGGTRFAEPARRWAIHTQDGGLVFADTDQLTPPVSGEDDGEHTT